jgi:hypothetical protein
LALLQKKVVLVRTPVKKKELGFPVLGAQQRGRKMGLCTQLSAQFLPRFLFFLTLTLALATAAIAEQDQDQPLQIKMTFVARAETRQPKFTMRAPIRHNRRNKFELVIDDLDQAHLLAAYIQDLALEDLSNPPPKYNFSSEADRTGSGEHQESSEPSGRWNQTDMSSNILHPTNQVTAQSPADRLLQLSANGNSLEKG